MTSPPVALLPHAPPIRTGCPIPARSPGWPTRAACRRVLPPAADTDSARVYGAPAPGCADGCRPARATRAASRRAGRRGCHRSAAPRHPIPRVAAIAAGIAIADRYPPGRLGRSLRRRLVEHLLRRHRDDLGIIRHKMATLDQLYEVRADLARDKLADAAVLLDVAPFTDQVEMVGVFGVAAQHAVLHLRRRAVERVVVAVIELVEQLDKFVAASRFHLEIVDMEVVAFRRQRYQSHRILPFRSVLCVATTRLLRFARNDNKGLSLRGEQYTI